MTRHNNTPGWVPKEKHTPGSPSRPLKHLPHPPAQCSRKKARASSSLGHPHRQHAAISTQPSLWPPLASGATPPPLASIRQMSGQGSRGSAGEYQADERAGVARLSWRVSGR